MLFMLYLFLRDSSNLIHSRTYQSGSTSRPSELGARAITGASTGPTEGQATTWWRDIAILGDLTLISEYGHLVPLEQLAVLPRQLQE